MPPVCHHMVTSQGSTPVQTLGANDALSFDVQGNDANGVRLMVLANRDVRVNAMIIDAATGNIVAITASGGIAPYSF